MRTSYCGNDNFRLSHEIVMMRGAHLNKQIGKYHYAEAGRMPEFIQKPM